jgi:hypothetical protein
MDNIVSNNNEHWVLFGLVRGADVASIVSRPHFRPFPSRYLDTVSRRHRVLLQYRLMPSNGVLDDTSTPAAGLPSRPARPNICTISIRDLAFQHTTGTTFFISTP